MLTSYGNGDGPYDAHLARAHLERAEMFATLASGVGAEFVRIMRRAARGLVRASRSIVWGMVRGRNERAAVRELQALDDRLLNDIGISRHQIPVFVKALLTAERDAASGSTKNDKTAALPDQDANVLRSDETRRRAA